MIYRLFPPNMHTPNWCFQEQNGVTRQHVFRWVAGWLAVFSGLETVVFSTQQNIGGFLFGRMVGWLEMGDGGWVKWTRANVFFFFFFFFPVDLWGSSWHFAFLPSCSHPWNL